MCFSKLVGNEKEISIDLDLGPAIGHGNQNRALKKWG